MIRIVIEADMNTGIVKVTGPIDEPRVMDWALHEAQRAVDDRTRKRDEASQAAPDLVIAHLMPRA